MEKNVKRGIFFLLTFLSLSIVSASYSLDITGLKTENYLVGEDIKFTVILLEEGQKVNDNIELKIYDVLRTKEITRTIDSNKEQKILLDDTFPNGLWKIEVSYKEEKVERNFNIEQKTSVEFEIIDGNLIIRNTGNSRYQKTISIQIGDSESTKTLNIPVGEEKEWKLVAPEGVYDIVITDGETTLSKKNIKLIGGTGNVIGAIDENLVGYSGFGVTPVEDIEDKFISLNKLPLAIIFVVVIFGLGILIGIERLSKRR